MAKRRFHLIGISPLFEDLTITMRSRNTHEVRYERGIIKHLCLEAGLKEKAAQFSRSTGGSAANIICMLTQLDDYSLGCFAKLGSDVISDWLIRDLKNFRVNTDGILREQGEVGASIIVTNPEIRDRSIISYRGVGDRVSHDDIREKNEYLIDTEWHNISSFTRNTSIKAVIELVELEKKNGIKLFFTPSISMISAFKKETLNVVHNSQILSLNDVEAMELSNINNVQEAAVFLKGLGPKFVFVTLGRYGILALDDRNCYRIGTYSVKISNTVGAGDLCAAVFWDGIYKGLGIEDILWRASAASAIKVQTSGAKNGLPDNEKISRFLKEKGKKRIEISPRARFLS
jgi:sugar/nucleoside kinase (ribokinase family)